MQGLAMWVLAVPCLFAYALFNQDRAAELLPCRVWHPMGSGVPGRLGKR